MMQPALSTTASSGIPAGARRADDMTPEAWTGLIGGLMEFLGEEAKEPEHAADAQPHGAGIVFMTPERKALFLKRSSNGDHPGEYAFPGGGVEAGENAAETARREAREETGHPADGELHPIDRRKTGGVDFVTFAHPVDEEFEPRLNGEHTEHAWAPLGEPPQPLHPGVEATLKGNDSMPIKGGGKSSFDPGTSPEVNAADAAKDAEHTATIKFNGDFDMAGLLKHLHHLGAIGASRAVEAIDADDKPVKFGWDGDGADKIVEAEVDGKDVLAADESIDGVEVDAEHDGPWMSCMSKDRRTMYRNRHIPGEVEIDGDVLPVDAILVRHEKAEVEDLEKELALFAEENGREPDDQERKEIYLKTHKRSGTPAERKFVEEIGGPGLWRKWSAWCRGEEAKIERLAATNPPPDADVKPIPHGHGDLEAEDAAWSAAADIATDWALRMALDRESVRSIDHDGRLHVEVANICEANICPYKGEEIPGWDTELKLDPDKIYRLLRDPEELEKALPSANSLQIMKRHVPVNADDHQPWETVGATGSTATWVAPCIQNSLVIWAQDAIDDIESGEKRELSPGYHYRPDLTPGSYQGETYDGVMRDIKFNHLALVETGRQGKDVVIGDSTDDAVLWAILEREIAGFVEER